MRPDDQGILGNLPRRRPGTRSEKRTGGRTTAPPAPEPVDGDPLRDAARVAGQAADAVRRGASRLASGVLARLPRP